MKIIHTIEELRAWRKSVGTIAFVPTMGNLHAGHMALVREARKHANHVVVSIFVNRLQFGPREDFERYPRTLAADCDKLRAAGVDVVFAPDEKEIYLEPQTFVVEPSAFVKRVNQRWPLSDQKNTGGWQRNDAFWDEFNGRTLDAAKWSDHNPTWTGRQPGWFNPANVKLENTLRSKEP